MLFLKRVLIELYYSFTYYIPGTFFEVLKRVKYGHCISLISYLDMKWGCFHKQNWGDDMNVFLVDLWFQKNVVCYNTSLLSKLLPLQNYAFIGSILQDANKNTIVWGSGLLFENKYPQVPPKKICAVRGPLSRDVLVKHGISCPAIYGDPILLISRYYRPQVRKKYRIGIIPHMYDEEDSTLKEYLAHHRDARLISLKQYENWQEVIDNIIACEHILSSSLHGLIVADAYGIANTWIEFEKQAKDKIFKFHDYFASVKRCITEPVIISLVSDIDTAIKRAAEYEPIDIDLQPLIKSCPFPLPFEQ